MMTPQQKGTLVFSRSGYFKYSIKNQKLVSERYFFTVRVKRLLNDTIKGDTFVLVIVIVIGLKLLYSEPIPGAFNDTGSLKLKHFVKLGS